MPYGILDAPSRERESDVFALAVGQGHGLALRAVALLPGFDLVGSRRKTLDRETAGVVRNGMEGIVEDADVARHPGVDVAFHLDDLGLSEEAGDLLALDRHADIEGRVGFRDRMQVVQRRVAV